MRSLLGCMILFVLLAGCSGSGEEAKNVGGPKADKVPEYKPPPSFTTPGKATEKAKKVEFN